MSEQRPMSAPGGTQWGFPKGVLLLSFTEMWERFSYYGMLAILVLYLSASTAEGGFGWSEPDALHLYGLYSGLAFTAPLIGGWIANNYWGERRCILVGGLMIALGHGLLAGPSFVPAMFQMADGVDYRALFAVTEGALGNWSANAKVAELLAAGHPVDPARLTMVYQLVTATFLGGLTCIIAGTALLKPTISSIIGRFYDEKDRRRDSAFALFLVGIYLGEILGVFITGYLGESVAWHIGFGAAGIGMTLGLLVYLRLQSRYIGDLGRQAMSKNAGGLAALRGLNPVEQDRVKVIVILALLTAIYSAALYQNGGLLTLFAKDHVDRDLWGWEMPASWFMMITSIVFVIFTPYAARLWERLERQGRNPSTPIKLAWGLFAIGAAFLLIFLVARFYLPAGGRVSPLWLIALYLLFGVSEVLVWTGQLSITSRLAPVQLSAFFVGGWYVNIGLGTWLTGHIGALGYSWGLVPAFGLLAVMCLVGGLAVVALNPWLKRKMHGLED